MQALLVSQHTTAFSAALIICFSLLLLCWPQAAAFWHRYQQTQSLERPPLQLADLISTGIFFTVATAFTLIVFFGVYPAVSATTFRFLVGLLILLLFWMIAIWQWAPTRQPQRETPAYSNEHVGQYTDEPISHEAQDLLGRVPFVEGLYRAIVNLPSPNAFVFGLYGSWGEGKTSVLNLLQRRLDGNREIIPIAFNPWYLATEAAMIQAFYSTIEQALQKDYIIPGLHRTLKRYRDLLVFGLRYIGLEFSVKDNPERLRRELEAWVDRLGRRLIIIIDDVDRLQPEEILAVFKLARLSGRLRNAVFLLSFDPVIVMELLKELAHIDPEFLEKVVQKPVPLPPAEQGDIDRFLFFSDPSGSEANRSAIDRLLDDLNIEPEMRKRFDEKMTLFYRTHLRRLFPTMRAAKRYLDGLRATLPAIVKEVHLYDFFLLETIRVFFPKVYRDIWTHPWIYAPAWSQEVFLTSPYGLMREGDQKYEMIRTHVNELLNEFGAQRDLLKEILEELFFVQIKNAFKEGGPVNHDNFAPTYRAEKRLTHSTCFASYFLFKIPSSEFADRPIEELIEKWNTAAMPEAEAIIQGDLRDYQRAGQLKQLFEKLHIFKKTLNPNRIPVFVRALYRMVPRLSRAGANLRDSEFGRVEGFLVTLIEECADESDIRPMLEEVIGDTDYLPFVVLVVMHSNRTVNGSLFRIYKNVNAESIRKLGASRLQNYYVNGSRDIFAELPDSELAFVISQWGTDWGAYTQENRSIVNEYIMSLVDQNPRYLGKLLECFITQTLSGEYRAFNLADFSKIFDPVEVTQKLDKYGDDVLTTPRAEAAATLLRNALSSKSKPGNSS